MKPGYGAKPKKKSKRKQNKKGADDGDVNMRMAEDGNVQAPADTSAKERLKDRLEHKKALKLKVQSLKNSRTKLTKLPVGNSRRREYSQQIKQAVEEFTSNQKQVAKQAPEPAAALADAGNSMVE